MTDFSSQELPFVYIFPEHYSGGKAAKSKSVVVQHFIMVKCTIQSWYWISDGKVSNQCELWISFKLVNMVHRWLTARKFSVLNLDNPRLYQCSNEDHEGRNLRLAERLLYLILESLRLNRLLRKDQLLSHHCLMAKISNL